MDFKPSHNAPRRDVVPLQSVYRASMASSDENRKQYRKINKMTKKELIKSAEKRGIEGEELSQRALKVLVMQDSGVSTCGGGENGKAPDGDGGGLLGWLTAANVKKLGGWTKDLRQIPDVDIGKVKNYLMGTQKEEFSAEEMRCYR